MSEFSTDPESSSGCAVKMLVMLLVASALVGGGIYLVIQYANSQLRKIAATSVPSTPVPSVENAVAVSTPTHIDPPALVLARQLTTADPTSRKVISAQLNSVEGSKEEAIGFLATSLAESSADVKLDIVVALGFLAKTNSQALAPLLTALDDKTLRHEAMAALGGLGSAGMAAVPQLTTLAKNKKESKAVRAAARRTLNQIQGIVVPAKPVAAVKKTARRRRKN